MSHKIDSITQPTSGACVLVGTKVLENAVITGAAEQCKCHDGEENTLIRQYEAMLSAAESSKAEFLAKIELLDLLALQGSNREATNTAILASIGTSKTDVLAAINTAKSAILAEIPQECSLSDIYAMFDKEYNPEQKVSFNVSFNQSFS